MKSVVGVCSEHCCVIVDLRRKLCVLNIGQNRRSSGLHDISLALCVYSDYMLLLDYTVLYSMTTALLVCC